MKIKISTLFIAVFWLPFAVIAQQSYSVSNESDATVIGTSTLHDWEMTAEEISGKGMITVENGKVEDIKSLNLAFKVKSLKSGKNKMDDLAHEALEANSNPNITYKLSNIVASANGQMKAKGMLSIAGKTREVTVSGTVTTSGSKVIIKGSHDINMTEHDMEPPTAMFGTIKTGEMVTIEFEIVLTKS